MLGIGRVGDAVARYGSERGDVASVEAGPDRREPLRISRTGDRDERALGRDGGDLAGGHGQQDALPERLGSKVQPAAKSIVEQAEPCWRGRPVQVAGAV